MNEKLALRVLIEGRVQGVGYRYWVLEHAARLGLDGWVRNRRDGRVEAVISGPQEGLDEMLRRCHEGPSFARVDKLTQKPETDSVEAGFQALPTA